VVARFFVRVRVIRYQAGGIQVGCDSFQHTDHPRSVESNKLRLDIFIGPKIHNHVFATLQSLQPISAASQYLNFSRQAGSESVSDSVGSAFFFRPETPLDCRSWLSQTGISLASGALRSWWIRLELSPIAPAILRIDRTA
jgi:hypothetical protein